MKKLARSEERRILMSLFHDFSGCTRGWSSLPSRFIIAVIMAKVKPDFIFEHYPFSDCFFVCGFSSEFKNAFSLAKITRNTIFIGNFFVFNILKWLQFKNWYYMKLRFPGKKTRIYYRLYISDSHFWFCYNDEMWLNQYIFIFNSIVYIIVNYITECLKWS